MKNFKDYDEIGMEERLIEMCSLLESCVEFLEEEEIDIVMKVNGWNKDLNIMDLVDREKYRFNMYEEGIYKDEIYKGMIYKLYGGGLRKIEKREEFVIKRKDIEEFVENINKLLNGLEVNK